MAIYKYMDLSTSHITFNDNKLLQNDKDIIINYPYEEGYFIPITDETTTTMLNAGYSIAFMELINHAQNNQCNMIRLDRDGDIVGNLKKFNW